MSIDLLTIACEVGMIACGAVTIWAARSNARLRTQRDDARALAEHWKATERDTFHHYKTAHGAWLRLLNKEQERKAARRAHMRAIGIRGNQSPKRKKGG